MKKISLLLLTLFGAMNINAQVLEVYNGEILVKSYKTTEATHANFRPEIIATAITLDQTSVELTEGESITINATLTPENVDNKSLSWTSSDESVATVSSDGVINAVKEGTAIIIASVLSTSSISAKCSVKVSPKVYSGTTDGHEWIDLDLPSGTIWAKYNIGAKSVEESGDYFAWGETIPQEDKSYNWSTYKWCNGTDETLTKYCNKTKYGLCDDKDNLDSEDDAATSNWGGRWCMPTYEQLRELLSYTEKDYVKINDLYYVKLKSRQNDSIIYFPLFGDYENGTLNDDYKWSGGITFYGSYWTKTPCFDYSMSSYDKTETPSNAWAFDITIEIDIEDNDDDEDYEIWPYSRCCGCPIRAVLVP